MAWVWTTFKLNMGARDVNNIRVTMVIISEIARTRFTVQYCIKCLFDQFFQLWKISKNFRWYRKDQNECYWRCQSYWDDWGHSLEKYFSGNGQKWVIFIKIRLLFVGYFTKNIPILSFLKENILIYISISIFWNSTASQTEFKDIMWSWKIADRGWGQDFEVPRCNR